MPRRIHLDRNRDAVELGDELRAFLAQMVPLAVSIVSIEHKPNGVLIGYIDAAGRHEVVTWAAVSWQELD